MPEHSLPKTEDERIAKLQAENEALRAQVRELTMRLRREESFFREEQKHERDLRQLTGESPAMKRVRQDIQQVARTDSTVLILGETGTGKELVARAIHQLSPRRDHLLVKVNCAALGPHIITSELFGHQQGAFTGALKARVGRFELANHGTIFLDEIGEIQADIQVLLLRVLQEKVIERVGDNEPMPVDVRIVAATHRDLARDVSGGRFRADLFYRLNVFPLQLPPLRERREDIPRLVQHFLQTFSRRLSRAAPSVSAQTMELLGRYAWPGNIRELENVIERALIVSTGATLQLDPTWLKETVAASPRTLADVEKQSIVDALAKSAGRIYGPRGAAAFLGLKPSTLYAKMRRFNIPRDAHS